jgi:hypothetical protein
VTTAPVEVIRPGAAVRCGRRRAVVAALMSRGGRPHALTVAHVLLAGRRRRVEFPGAAASGWVAVCDPLRSPGAHPSDGALVVLDEGTPFVADHRFAGPLTGALRRPPPGLVVALVCSAGVAVGRLTSSDWSGRVRYPWGSRRLVGQLLVEVVSGPVPRRGDSGSLWITADGLGVGMQVAVVGRFAVVSPLAPLLERWNASLLRSAGAEGMRKAPLEYRLCLAGP